MVEKYLTLRQTFFPAGSSGVEEDQEQQSRALRAPRRRFISTEGQTNPDPQSPSFCLYFPLELLLCKWVESGSPFLPGLHPLCSATARRLVAPAQPWRSKPSGFLFPFPGEVRATSFYSARRRAFKRWLNTNTHTGDTPTLPHAASTATLMCTFFPESIVESSRT